MNAKMKITPLATAISLLVTQCTLFSSQVLAQTKINDASQNSTEHILVTANRSTEPVSNLVVPVIELSKEDIEKTQSNTLTEVLRQLPGIQLSNNGGYNQPSRIYVQGSSDVVVLLNGARLGSATLGYTDMSQVPLAGIEKIEYIRGARAAVYGADASAGVINISTKGDQSESKTKLNLTGGSDGYQSYEANTSLILPNDSWLNLTAQYQSSDGYNVAQFGSSDNDGFENTNFIADGGYQINSNWLARFTGLYHESRTDYDTAYAPSWDRNHTSNYNLTGQLIYHSEQFTSNLTYANNQDESEAQRHVPDSKTTTQRDYITWRNHYLLDETNSIGFGGEYLNDDVSESDTQYEEQERDNKAGYITLAHNGELVQLEGSLRYDDNEQFGDETTWQLGAGWQVSQPIRLTANAGTGFKAPTFNDLYYPGFSNPDLKPEESENYEVAIEGTHSLLDWRLAGFYKDIDNRITCQSAYSSCDNDSLDIKGVELTSEFDTGWINHQVSLEYLDPKDKATGKDAIRIARQNFKWQANYQYESWQANLSYIYQGKRYDFGREKLDEYSLLNLAASYQLSAAIRLSARVDNLFDEDYETANDYLSPERSYYGSIQYSF